MGIREEINERNPEEHKIAREVLNLDWYDVESQARRVIHHLVAKNKADDADLDTRMKAAGMFSAAQMLAGTPIDAFRKHAQVKDLDTFGQWLDLKCLEYVKMQARFELEKRRDDELYDWAVAHCAVFLETRVNFKAATGDSHES